MKPWFVILVPLALALPARADWGPDPILSTAWLDYPGPDPVSLFVLPDGGGRSFDQAMNSSAATVDATAHAQLINYDGQPMAGYPAEDIWLEASDGGLAFCPQGTCADQPTDAEGIATWSSAPRAGGSSQAGSVVLVSGSPLTWTSLPLHFNSADLNGDLQVSLTDVGLFAADFFGGYAYRSDFYHDGVINIADLGLMAQGMAAGCP